MRTNAAAPIRMEDVAAAACCSVRTLGSVFRRFRDTTPLAAFHAIRLEQVHAELNREAVAARGLSGRNACPVLMPGDSQRLIADAPERHPGDGEARVTLIGAKAISSTRPLQNGVSPWFSGPRTRDLLAPTASSARPAPSSDRRAACTTELQCGSDIFMDADFGRNLDRDGAPTKAFEPSLFVWATVMSRPTEDRAIVDAGLKALAFDSGPPLVCDEPAATYERASDEHGRLGISAATNRLRISDKIRLIPGHCNPTVNLYDWCVGIRGSRVEQLWPITARGTVY